MISAKTPESPISLQKVAVGYENKKVLSDISCSFNQNKITSILGKSGSGKTTLLQIVNGMLKPNTGEVKLFGEFIDYTQIHKLRLKIGYVVQHAGLFPHLSVQANISLLGKIIHQQKDVISSRLQRLLDLVQLPQSYLAKYPYELSGGEQQRVGLCRAMFLNPPIILMDEPFASLDFETKISIYKHLKDIQEHEPRTILLVTHDWDEALILSDNFVRLKDGYIEEAGDKSLLEQSKLSYWKNT